MHTALRSLRRAVPASQLLGRRAFVAAAVALAACGGGDDDGPTGNARGLTGTYNVASVQGQSATSVGLTGSFVIQSGNRWTMNVSDNTGAVADNGTYSGEGGTLRFSSEKFRDAFNGSIEDNNGRLTVRYDFGGRTGPATLVFTR